jgi:two-component system sensor histidine kinase DegS
MSDENAPTKSALELAELERLQCRCELHDGILQYLIGARMQIEALRSQIRQGQAVTDSDLEPIQEILLRGTREGRTWIAQLRGDSFHDQPTLSQSLEALIGEVKQKEAAAKIVMHLDPAIDQARLSSDAKLAAYRITQESLRNAIRHAQATQIEIHAKMQSDVLRLSIADDGCGFRPETVAREHFGVVGMRTRAAMTGAQFVLATKPGHGTTISAAWPARHE